MSKLETNTIDTVSGTTNLTIGSTNTSTITMPNGALSGQNYPAFHASLSATQDIADVTITKVEFDTELFDTDNCYDNTTNYRFTPTVAGKYFIYSHIDGDVDGTNKTDQVQLYIRKNGTTAAFTMSYPNTAAEANNLGLTLNTILEMNGTTDYVEIAAYIDGVTGYQPKVRGASTYSRSAFGAYRIGA